MVVFVIILLTVGCSSPDPALQTDFTKLQEEKAKLLQEKQDLEQQLIELRKASTNTGSNEKEIADLRNKLKSAEAEKPILEVEKDSPFDHVKDSEIRVMKQKIEINVADVFWWTIEDTNSMDPLIDTGSTALSVKPKDEKGVRNGDVAFYTSLLVDSVIVHRVIETNSDGKGWYSRFKGDNLYEPDPELVRFPQIEGVLIGVIY